MYKDEVLEKAIQKAIDGGWNFAGNNASATVEVKYRDDYFGNDPYFEVDWHMSTDNTEWSINDVIFNHNFAKAIWGWDVTPNGWPHRDGSEHVSPAWEYHLRQMVIADDPIQYLGDHL